MTVVLDVCCFVRIFHLKKHIADVRHLRNPLDLMTCFSQEAQFGVVPREKQREPCVHLRQRRSNTAVRCVVIFARQNMKDELAAAAQLTID